MSALGQRMSELVRACFTGIWIKSYEPDDAIAELTQLCRAENWSLMTWDIAQGLKPTGDATTTLESADQFSVRQSWFSSAMASSGS